MLVQTTFPKHVTLKQQFKLSSGFYTGICTMSNGLMVFADNENNEVKIIKPNGSKESSVNFEEIVYDVTNINVNHVAVSNPDSQTISIINVDSSKVIKTLRVRNEVRGLVLRVENIIF